MDPVYYYDFLNMLASSMVAVVREGPYQRSSMKPKIEPNPNDDCHLVLAGQRLVRSHTVVVRDSCSRTLYLVRSEGIFCMLDCFCMG